MQVDERRQVAERKLTELRDHCSDVERQRTELAADLRQLRDDLAMRQRTQVDSGRLVQLQEQHSVLRDEYELMVKEKGSLQASLVCCFFSEKTYFGKVYFSRFIHTE